MIDAPKTLKRRRRKRIVALVVLVSLVLAWWNWPRGDARFLGKWRLVDPTSMQPGSTLQFAGIGILTVTDQFQWLTDWRVQGDELQIGRLSASTGGGLRSRLLRKFFLWASQAPVVWRTDFKILSATSQEIRLKSPDGSESVLRRVPE
jgi:hypothetical protein